MDDQTTIYYHHLLYLLFVSHLHASALMCGKLSSFFLFYFDLVVIYVILCFKIFVFGMILYIIVPSINIQYNTITSSTAHIVLYAVVRFLYHLSL